MTEMKSNEE